MKKVVVFFLLFIFTIQSTKSLWIIASFQINREYIASNLCINRFDKIPTCKGQCLLNNKLDKEQKSNQKSLTTLEKDSFFIAPSFTVIKEPVNSKTLSKNKFSFYKESDYSSHTLLLDSPPKMLS